jgi:hypothetical protein
MDKFNLKKYLQESRLTNKNFILENSIRDEIGDILARADGEGLLQIAAVIGRDTSWVDVDDEDDLDMLFDKMEYDIKTAGDKDVRRLYNALKGEGIVAEKKSINESAPGYDNRKFGEPLPTLESVTTTYEEDDVVYESYEIGDEVILRGNYTDPVELKVVGVRRMFGSNLLAYEVEFPNGEVAEYDETQLSLNPKTIDMDKVFMKGKMSDEEIEDLETRADDHFSEPLKEGYSLNPEEVELMTSLRNQIDQGVLNSKQKDSFVGMLDGILNDYDVFLNDLEDKGSAFGNPLKEQFTTHGGYVELMDLDDHLDSIHYEFERWREGPSTEITDIEPAKEDVISYVVDYLRNTL